MHIKDRGNEALPVDIVKVLKTQDENYIRTMRASNIKVCFVIYKPENRDVTPLDRKLIDSRPD